MDYYLLADLAARLGCQLALAGAETFRVEDTVRRILRTYGVECEVFAIPNSLTVSFEATHGKPLTIMKRIGYHGNDLEALEQLNALSRRICREKPTVEEASEWLRQTMARCRVYRPAVAYLGSFLGGLGFALVFGGSLRDCLWAGLMGMIIGFVNRFLDRFEANPFFSTILASFLMAVPAYVAAGLGWLDNPDAAIIGALMILVPGLLITNSMRDIIYGDTNSGINRIVQVLLSAFAIALGTAAAWRITSGLYGLPVSTGVVHPFWVQGLAVLVGCVGFAIRFNVHGGGMWLCTLGGVATWMVYLLAQQLGYGVYSMNFFATLVAALYAEAMARIRKYPVTSYLVVSTFPLLPGAGIYYTMSLGLAGDFHAALAKGLETAGIAGCLAVGILLVSTLFRLPAEWKRRHGKR